MLKPIVPKFRSDLSVRLRDIAEKQVPAKLKPIVGILECFVILLPISLARHFVLFPIPMSCKHLRLAVLDLQ